VSDDSCAVAGCVDGQFCHIDFGDSWRVVAHCVRACDPRELNACASDELCIPVIDPLEADHAFRCERNCALPDVACAEGYECLIVGAGSGWCQPARPTALDPVSPT
jgi:hypothetical protein